MAALAGPGWGGGDQALLQRVEVEPAVGADE